MIMFSNRWMIYYSVLKSLIKETTRVDVDDKLYSCAEDENSPIHEKSSVSFC